jgi:hypothetical protein
LELPIDEFAPPPLRKKLTDINARIRALIASRAAFDQTIRTNFEADSATLNFDDLIGIDALRAKFVFLLQEELKLRAEFELIETLTQKAIAAECESSHQKLLKARADLRVALAKLGYLDVPDTENVVGKITPHFVESNPMIAALRNATAALHARISVRDFYLANEAANERIESELRKIKRTALSFR